MPDPLVTLALGAAELLGRSLTALESDQFRKYLELLLKWQRTARLVGRNRPDWIVENLFLDSLVFLRALPGRFGALADLGAGAGFPGVPIKIVRPDATLVLIEARQRRASFLSTAVRELGLSRVEVVNARAEDVVTRFAGQFDAVVMRCAGNTEALVPLATRFVHPGGCVVVSGPPIRSPRGESTAEWLEVPGLSQVRSGSPRR